MKYQRQPKPASLQRASRLAWVLLHHCFHATPTHLITDHPTWARTPAPTRVLAQSDNCAQQGQGPGRCRWQFRQPATTFVFIHRACCQSCTAIAQAARWHIPGQTPRPQGRPTKRHTNPPRRPCTNRSCLAAPYCSWGACCGCGCGRHQTQAQRVCRAAWRPQAWRAGLTVL